MALKPLKEAKKNIVKDYGETAIARGSDILEIARLPTGIMALDIALGGGFPLGAMSLIYGAESSGKTSLCYRAVASYQRRNPKKVVAWVDAENQHDPKWAALHGVDGDALIVVRPTTAEEAADAADELAYAKEIGLIVVDSMAALASYDQLDKSAHQVIMGGAAKPTTTLLRKLAGGITEHSRESDPLTVLIINQIRHKLGFVMGNPEILPGPAMQNYMAFLKLRLAAKPILKEKIAPVPIYAENSARIVKKKFPIIRNACEWHTILYPHDEWKPLDVNNAKYLDRILTDLEYLVKAGSKWQLFGEDYATKKEAVAAALGDYDKTLQFLVDDLLQLYAGT